MKKVRWKSKRANKNLREETERDHIKPHALSSLSPPLPSFFPSPNSFLSLLSSVPSSLPSHFSSLHFYFWSKVSLCSPEWPDHYGWGEAASHTCSASPICAMCLVLVLLHSSIHVAREILGDWAWGAVSSRMHTRVWLLSLDLSHGNGYSLFPWFCLTLL